MDLFRVSEDMSFRSGDAKTENRLLPLKYNTTLFQTPLGVDTCPGKLISSYLSDDVTILSMDQGDCSQIPQDTKSLIKL